MIKFLLYAFLFTSLYSNEALVSTSPSTMNRNHGNHVLNDFFRDELETHLMGYVLFDTKPLCYHPFHSLDEVVFHDFGLSKDVFKKTCVMKTVIPLIESINNSQNKFLIKVFCVNAGEADMGGEIVFINIPKLKDVIRENIALIRYIVGSTITPDQFYDYIVYTDKSFNELMCQNSVLSGIVLGYGTHNSLCGGRSDEIAASFLVKDTIPFSPNGIVYLDNKEHLLFNYIENASGENHFEADLPNLSRGFKFANANLLEEQKALEKLHIALPECLGENPRFVCAAYEGDGTNPKFFQDLVDTQNKIKKLLNDDNLAEKVLALMGVKEPVTNQNISKSFDKERYLDNKSWIKVLERASEKYNSQEKKLAFIDAFTKASTTEHLPWLGATQNSLIGFKVALANLEAASISFANHAKDPTLDAIVPEYLYYKILISSDGKKNTNSSFVRVSYIFKNAKGEILSAKNDEWIDLEKTIPGFAHAMVGMNVGETREVYVHPGLGYGVLTSFPSCAEIIAEVKLIDFDEKIMEKLPSLEPLDLDWIKDRDYESKVIKSLNDQPIYAGGLYRKIFDNLSVKENIAVIDHFNKLFKCSQYRDGLQ